MYFNFQAHRECEHILIRRQVQMCVCYIYDCLCTLKIIYVYTVYLKVEYAECMRLFYSRWMWRLLAVPTLSLKQTIHKVVPHAHFRWHWTLRGLLSRFLNNNVSACSGTFWCMYYIVVGRTIWWLKYKRQSKSVN